MRNLFIVSGASQGFGSSLTLELAKCVKLNDGDALYVLLQRSQVNTREIQTEFQSANTPFKAEFISLSIDFESKSVEEKLLDLFARLGNEEFKKSFLFNNAGTIGTLQNIQDYSYQSIFQCIHTNLVSTMLLTSVFLRRYPISTIVNISSLAAIEAFETWGCYSATKAGLDIFHRTICKENPKVRVLNYAPGPLDTDMQKKIRETMPDGDLKKFYINMKTANLLICPNVSAVKLLNILIKDEFSNGEHIDFYDLSDQ